ncbi:hypothetical protein [Catenuloplanes japonicus]|uniref:hypothetical protein n=1 Tax=Catenuloplanes japonicus TaxID=33876 RepID=UPI0005271AFA|nr:hypothetical protein [Catenuloplanes japonicus]
MPHPDPHRDSRVNVRAPADEQDAARNVLVPAGWTLQQFIQACLRAVASESGPELLPKLLPYRTEVSKGGRPPKTPAG